MKKNNEILKIQPIGGVGQIGANMAVISTPAQDIIIDSGILFPRDDFYDLKYLIPDYSSLKRPPTDIILTHGHEDHIGAMIHLLENFPEIKLHAPPFAAALLRRKLDFNDVEANVNVYDESSVFRFQEMDIYPIHVNHSIPDTFGLLIKDKKGLTSTFYVSDFKYDEKNPYEKPMDLKRLSKLSRDSQKRILFADSTSITGDPKATSEGDLIPVLEDLISDTKGRIFVTAFSSNIHRMRTIINAAYKAQKKVVLCGRSMESYLDIANQLNMLEHFDLVIKSVKSVDNDDKNIVVLVSGCQGDFRSALRRIANGDNPQFVPDANDTFIFSSRTIPGNEKKISGIINGLCSKGSRIITSNEMPVHASGHGGTEDLGILYESFKPDNLIPIHGETYLLRRHYDFILSNYPHISPHLLANYDSFHIDSELNIKVTNDEPLLPILIHGKQLPIESTAIGERRKMACNGVIFLSIKKDSIKKFCRVIMEYEFMGLPDLVLDHEDHFKKLVVDHLKKNKIKDREKTQEEVRIMIRRFFNAILGYKPIVMVHFI